MKYSLRNFKRDLIILWFCAVIIGIFAFANQVNASPSNLEINYPEKPGPLFSENNIAPGDSFSKIVAVTNNSPNEEMFAFRISSIVGDTPLASVLNLQVKRSGQILLDDLISNLKNPDERDIGMVSAGATDNFDFIVTMLNVGNEYQGLKITTADFILGFSKEGEVLGEKTEVGLGQLPATGSKNYSLTLLFGAFVIIIYDVLKRIKKIKI